MLNLPLPRFSFCALATLALLGRLDAVDTDATASFVLSCMNFDGGFGSRPGAESHAGLIYTCVGRFLTIEKTIFSASVNEIWQCGLGSQKLHNGKKETF